MTGRPEGKKRAVFDAYMDASQALYEETYGFLVEAGYHRRDEELRAEIRSILDGDGRSSMKTVMIREALNAYAEGVAKPFVRCQSLYASDGPDCDLRVGHEGRHIHDYGDAMDWMDDES